MQIRDERSEDEAGIRELLRAAFPTPQEAALVDRLRTEHALHASLVAAEGERVVGHAAFSAAQLALPSGRLAISALGPLAVLRDWQRRGLAAALVRAGLQRCWERRVPAVIVLGDPQYYGRFGFRRADAWAIRCELDVPAEAFMISWSGAPQAGPGVAHYHPAFADV